MSKAKSINDLTKDIHDFVESKGWYAADTTRPQTPRNIAISLSLEASEVLEHFQWNEDPAPARNQKELASELADVALYLLQLSSLCGIDLELAIADKLEANYKRKWE